ncbi:heterokaryon incompatibility, partial [Lasiosphaeris hirsuta]
FSALSYRWGDETPVFEISLNGCAVLVRENLRDFLLHARKAGWTKNLWIDAVCINQNDVEEKNQQIGLMGAVYSLASSVLVWLGNLDTAETTALEEMRDLGQAVDYSKKTAELWEKRWFPSDFNGYNPWIDRLSPAGRRGFDQLIANPYWTRKWIVQEILL